MTAAVAGAIHLFAPVRENDPTGWREVSTLPAMHTYTNRKYLNTPALQRRYPVHIWKDAESLKMRMDTYNHTNSLITTKVLLPPPP